MVDTPGASAPGAEDLGGKLVELDCLYKAADRIYLQFARSCGLSACAYWTLYELQVAGGSAPLRRLCDTWCYSKQTVTSALKTLEAKGLIEVGHVSGSRKLKQASLTEAGRSFCEANIVPGIEAERRAFMRLSHEERETIVELVRMYTRALDAEFAAMQRARSGREGGRA